MDAVHEALAQFVGRLPLEHTDETLYISAGNKMIARTTEHNTAHIVIDLQVVKRVAQQRAHFIAQRVARFRSVHRQRRDMIFDSYFEVGHKGTFHFRKWFWEIVKMRQVYLQTLRRNQDK